MDPELYRLYLIKINQIEMMRLRGYKIGKRDEFILGLDYDEFVDYFYSVDSNTFVEKINTDKSSSKVLKEILTEPRGMLSYDYAKEDEKGRSCAVVYITRKEAGRIEKSFTQSLMGILRVLYIDIIIISDRALTQDSKHIINIVPMAERGVPRTVWLFRDEELYVNPVKHVLSPKYELLSKADTKEFKRRYVNPTLISTEDPAVKFYGWKVNNVVKITRDISSLNADVKEMVTKRLVVKSAIVKDIAE